MQKCYEESENAYKSALYIAENAHGFSQLDAISTMNSLANIMLEQVGSDFTEINRERIEFISDLLVKGDNLFFTMSVWWCIESMCIKRDVRHQAMLYYIVL